MCILRATFEMSVSKNVDVTSHSDTAFYALNTTTAPAASTGWPRLQKAVLAVCTWACTNERKHTYPYMSLLKCSSVKHAYFTAKIF